MQTYSFAHMPQQADGRRAKAGVGSVGVAYITAKDEGTARQVFAQLYPQREVTASGIVGVEA